MLAVEEVGEGLDVEVDDVAVVGVGPAVGVECDADLFIEDAFLVVVD